MDENYTEKKKSNVLKYALTFVAGTAIGVGGLFGYNTFIAKSPKLVNNCATVDETTIKKDDNSTDKTDNNTNYYNTLTDSTYTYNPYFGDTRSIYYTISGKDMKSCSIVVNKSYVATSYNVKINSNSMTIGASVTFDVPIKQVIFGGKGQAVSNDDCVLFLLQDGTVRYLNFVQAFTSPEFTANYDKLPEPKVVSGVSDVDVLYQTSVYNNDPNYVGGHGETIAIKKDGSIINIMDLIK